MIDSGACVSVCPVNFKHELGIDNSNGNLPELLTATGKNVTIDGIRKIPVNIAGNTIVIDFIVCDVERPLLSTACLTSIGYKITFDINDKCFVENDNIRVYLEKFGDHFYLRVPRVNPEISDLNNCKNNLELNNLNKNMYSASIYNRSDLYIKYEVYNKNNMYSDLPNSIYDLYHNNFEYLNNIYKCVCGTCDNCMWYSSYVNNISNSKNDDVVVTGEKVNDDDNVIVYKYHDNEDDIVMFNDDSEAILYGNKINDSDDIILLGENVCDVNENEIKNNVDNNHFYNSVENQIPDFVKGNYFFEIDDSCGDGRNAIGKNIPKTPSANEVEKHNLTHLPYKDWCFSCVSGRSIAHKSVPINRENRPSDSEIVVQIDYCFFGRQPVLVASCTRTNMTMAKLVRNRSPTEESVKNLSQFLLLLGHPCICLQSDGEAGLKLLMDKVQAAICRDNPGGSKGSGLELFWAIVVMRMAT